MFYVLPWEHITFYSLCYADYFLHYFLFISNGDCWLGHIFGVNSACATETIPKMTIRMSKTRVAMLRI